MLIRVSGYNTGAQEYLEQGNKSGREFTRDELDHRMIIDGQLSVTRAIYESIPDHGQDRYLTFTMSFKEETVSPEVLKAVTAEFKQFLMHAYKSEEFNFYAEAHLPKMKTITDKKTGELIERKPHIHIIVPRINLLSGNEANPVDVYMNHEKYFEAFQEYINQTYNLSSPRESVRADITDAASVLSRYKGDDFYGKNRDFKQELVKQVIERGVTSRAGFYALAAEYGETKVRNQGKDNEYLSVKLPGDAKGTNLKDTIFQDDFIVRRELKKPPLEAKVIQERLLAWPQRAREIKYVSKATPSFRKLYSEASPDERVRLLSEREHNFYQIHGEHHGNRTPTQPRDRQRSPVEADAERYLETTFSVPDLSGIDVADHGQASQARRGEDSVLLPGDARLHVGQQEPGGNPGLRPSVQGGGRGRGKSAERSGRPQRVAAVSTSAEGTGKSRTGRARRAGNDAPGRRAGHRIAEYPYPPGVLNPHRVQNISDIEARGRRLFDPLKDLEDTPAPSATEPVTESPQSPAGAWSKKSKGSAAKSGRSAKRFAADTRPLYARNPFRVAGISDIEARARQLFGAAKDPSDPVRYIKLPSLKALTVNRKASTVAAYFTRQAEHNQLLPAQRHALRRVNKQFFDLRRAVFSDQRLTRQDKAQFASVLAFERLKAHEAIHNPQHHQEVVLMGSAEIRKLIVEDVQEDPGFSISGPKGLGINRAAPEGVRARVKQALDKMSQRLEPKPQSEQERERERELNAKDLYTRKARFSPNVHYLDKTTNKTLFVDTGKAIAMRRTGITESGVAVALQLAKERFGSTLTINGTAEFKKLVIEAAAKNGIDVHFTDKAMNQGLADRRAELEIEREGQGIEQPSAVELKVVKAAQADAAKPATVSPAKGSAATAAPTFKPDPVEVVVGAHPVQVDVSDDDQVHQVVKDLVFQEKALGERVAMLSAQSEFLARRLNTAPLSNVADMFPHTFELERQRVTELGQEATAIPNNLLQDATRLGWYREGVVSTIESLRNDPQVQEPAQASRLASASTMLNTVDSFIATVEARTVTVMQPPSGGMTFDDVAHKLAGISAEIAQTQELRVQQTRSLERLSDAVAFQDVPMGYSFRAPIVQPPELVQLKTLDQTAYENERLRFIALGEEGKAVPANIQRDKTRLEWFREGVENSIKRIESSDNSKFGDNHTLFMRLERPNEILNDVESLIAQIEANGAEIIGVDRPVDNLASELVQLDTQWREGLELSEADIVGSATAMQVRGDNHANWLVATADKSPEAVALITQHMSNDAYRESFKEAIQGLYALPSNTEKDIALLDASTGFVDDLVNRVEGRSASDALQPSAAKPADRKVLQGELLAHGAAPYQFNEKLIDKPLSYFVTIKPEVGKPRTVWGVDLERVMSGDPAPFKAGDRIRVEDLGTMPVTVPETQADGSVIQKSTFRREWAADLVDAGKDVANAAPASATAVAASPAVTPIEPEQDHGMNVD
jgi:hypothetical protein